MFLLEPFLNGMKFAIFAESLNGLDFGSLSLNGEKCTRLYRITINVDSTGATHAAFTTDVGTCVSEFISERVNE